MRSVIAVAVAAAAVLTGCSGSIHLAAPGVSNAQSTTLTNTVSVPRGGRASAELDVVSGFTTLSITAAPLGDGLVRVNGKVGFAPLSATLSGNTVAIANTGAAPGSDTAQIVLNANVRWRVALDAGDSSALIDLSSTRVDSLEVTQGVSSLVVTLPAQTGTTALMLAAGVSSLNVHTRGNEPVRATLSAGAGNAVIDGVVHTGIAAGSSFASTGWDSARNRVDIECSAGIGALVIDQL